MTSRSVLVSVIIPARNAAAYLGRSLPAALAALPVGWELVLVDDASTDETAQVAEAMGARVIRLKERAGAAGARNVGITAAAGDVLVFVDADVEVHPSTFDAITDLFAAEPEIDAVFGSYDAQPADQHLVSQYRNLLHHYHHQRGQGRAATFWTGCGAVRRRVVDAVGPFRDAGLCCMEDVDYGYRMNGAGFRVELHPEIQCRHLKRWTLGEMIRTDMFRRGVPWTVMMLQRGKVDDALNVSWRERGSAAAVVVAGAGAVGALLCIGNSGAFALMSGVILIALAGFAGLQRPFFGFLARVRGWRFALGCVPLHLVYFGCAVLGGVIGVMVWACGALRR